MLNRSLKEKYSGGGGGIDFSPLGTQKKTWVPKPNLRDLIPNSCSHETSQPMPLKVANFPAGKNIFSHLPGPDPIKIMA